MNFRNTLIVILCAISIVGACTFFVGRNWTWLSSPENSTAMQAAIAIIIGAPTLIFVATGTLAAIESARSSARQAVAADRQAEAAIAQAEAAKDQIRLSKFQFDEQEKHFEVQRRIDRLKELAEYERLVAEDNASRPRFAIVSAISRTNRANVELKNVGGGDALDVEIVSPVSNSPRVRQDIVRAGAIFRCALDLIDMEIQPAICKFTSVVGSRWEVKLMFQNGLTETEASASRPYEKYVAEVAKADSNEG
jgi:hypothetical protein